MPIREINLGGHELVRDLAVVKEPESDLPRSIGGRFQKSLELPIRLGIRSLATSGKVAALRGI